MKLTELLPQTKLKFLIHTSLQSGSWEFGCEDIGIEISEFAAKKIH